METNEKQFDAVKMMREIRDKLSHEFEGMSLEEEKAYIRKYANTPISREAKGKRQTA
jgi:hypothetical protein